MSGDMQQRTDTPTISPLQMNALFDQRRAPRQARRYRCPICPPPRRRTARVQGASLPLAHPTSCPCTDGRRHWPSAGEGSPGWLVPWRHDGASAPETSTVGARCNHPRMGWIDTIDGLNEFLPRRWKRWLSAAVVGGFLAFPSQAQRAVLWYGQERAQQITKKVIPF